MSWQSGSTTKARQSPEILHQHWSCKLECAPALFDSVALIAILLLFRYHGGRKESGIVLKITRKRVTAVLGAVVAGLLLAACGATPSPTTTTDTSTTATVPTTSENMTPSSISSPTPDLAAAEAAQSAAESSAAA